jgi:hypothetical protein
MAIECCLPTSYATVTVILTSEHENSSNSARPFTNTLPVHVMDYNINFHTCQINDGLRWGILVEGRQPKGHFLNA